MTLPRFNQRLLIAVMAMVGMLIFVAGYYVSNREPTYQDKTVTEWIRDYDLDSQGRKSIPVFAGGQAWLTRHLDPPNAPAYVALKEIGPTALPYLVAALHTNETAFARRYAGLHARAPVLVRRILPTPSSPTHIQFNAVMALQDLKEDALPILPQMIELLGDQDTNAKFAARSFVQRFRTEAMRYPQAWERLFESGLSNSDRLQIIQELNPPANLAKRELKRIMVSSDRSNQMLACYVSLGFEDEKGEFILSYRSALHDPNAEVRYTIAGILSRNRTLALSLLPSLQLALRDSYSKVRYDSALAIENIGTEAHDALPDLERAAEEDADSEVRRVAQRAAGKLRNQNRHLTTNE